LYAITSLLIIITFSILINRIATVALTLTGLSRESARFQARSALTGVGFTTNEAEHVVNHPVRRRIIMLLMLTGSAGVVTAIASLIISFTDIKTGTSFTLRILFLLAGVALLWAAATNRVFDRYLSKLITWALRRYTHLALQDYSSLLHLAKNYMVTEMDVDENDWMANRRLAEVKFKDEGILVLGITRADGTYIGAPAGPTRILPKDRLILYGRRSTIEKVVKREKGIWGDIEHEQAVAEQAEIRHQEEKQDPAAKDSENKKQ
jgi:hypothetical protein